MEDTPDFNLADTYVQEDTSLKPVRRDTAAGSTSDFDGEDMTETYVLDDDAINNAERIGMTGILKDLGEQLDETDDAISPASPASSGYTIELSLDDDDY